MSSLSLSTTPERQGQSDETSSGSKSGSEKVCRTCGETKALSEFSKSARTGHAYICKTCDREKCKQFRAATREKWKAFMKEAANDECSECGYGESSWALELHHVDPSLKSFTVSGFITKYGFTAANQELVREEIKKCVVLCANCHRELHERLT